MANLSNIVEVAKKTGCQVLENEPLKNHTSFKIGGNATLFIVVNDTIALKKIIEVCKIENYPMFILGKGSNVLADDEGIESVVIKLDGEFKSIKSLDEHTIYCGAGVNLSKLCHYAFQNELSGLEFAYGIPGTVGGAVYMNAGAYGGEMKNVLFECTHIDMNGEVSKFTQNQLDLSYRHSVYSSDEYIIIGATLKLIKSDMESIKSKMDDFLNRRKDKQPLEYPSAGSVFKRPINNFAGTLIEKSNLKGYSIGGAKVSTKHAGFIINKENATSKDVKNLIKHIQKTVKNEHDIDLECEVKFIGGKSLKND